MARKNAGHPWFISDEVIARLKDRKTQENRKDSMTAYIQWIVDQYAVGAMTQRNFVLAGPATAAGMSSFNADGDALVKAVRVRKLRRHEQRKAS